MRITKVYTKTGDDGSTSLSDGTRIKKNSSRIKSIGSIDELNASLGIVLSSKPVEIISKLLYKIQNDLFNLGGEISIIDKNLNLVTSEDIKMIEEYKKWTGNLDDLRSVSYTIVNEYEIENIEEQYSVRLIRDYISRGLLGSTERAGKELFFKYENLLRFIVVRVMLADGWSLTKIQDQLSLSTLNITLV